MPIAEATDWLAQRINLPTDSWLDVSGDLADSFFTAAGAKGAVLNELRTAVDRAITEGWRPEEFQAEFEKIAERWEHTGDAGWRSNLILRTNLQTVYSIGREAYQFDPQVRQLQPYLLYNHSDALNPRPLHLALDQQVFTHDTIPFSLSNGFGCTCRYTSLSQRQLDAMGLEPSTVRPGDQIPVQVDGQTYNPVVEPAEGWNRQPLADRTQARQATIQRVIDRSSPGIADMIRAAIAAFLGG
jgi:hypothetical protein